MKIGKISIKNFRCFPEYEMDFAKQVTVLIGKNGSGKSTLINALHKALSVFFTTGTKFNEKTLASGNPDLKVANIPPTDVWYDDSKMEVAEFVSVQCEAVLNGSPLTWEMKKGSTSRAGLQSTLYKKAYLSFMKEYKKTKNLPLFSYYSDSYPHIGTNIGKYAKYILNNGKPLPPNFGYYQWDAETSCTSIWEQRFLKVWAEMLNFKLSIDLISARRQKIIEDNPSKQEINQIDSPENKNRLNKEIHEIDKLLTFKTNESSKYPDEIGFITRKLIEFSKPISYDVSENLSFEIKDVAGSSTSNKNQITFTFTDDRMITFDQLPQGFRRLISIVFDITYRSYVLNKEVDTYGIVMIDEIDLHLHPSLEQEVLLRFIRSFPNLQFIVSTHSPLVITNLKQDDDNRVIVQMKYENGVYDNSNVPNVFGIDYSIGVTDIMGTPARNSTVENMIDSIIRLKLREKEDIAKRRYEELKSFVNGDMSMIDEEIEKRVKANQ